ncbi:MAG: hypothetical protein H7336_02155 [Bacteriovorax sp.]|nr:hypothetical protein [Bacteriovorax sp.]
MNFKEYVKSAKRGDPKIVASEFKTNFTLMESVEDVTEMTNLIVHVCGEKLGEWEQGLELLKKLKNNAKIPDKSHMDRSVAILTLGNNPNTSIEKFSSEDQIIIYTTTAAAIKNLGGLKNAEKLLQKAEELK